MNQVEGSPNHEMVTLERQILQLQTTETHFAFTNSASGTISTPLVSA